jgi:hypothetical protein
MSTLVILIDVAVLVPSILMLSRHHGRRGANASIAGSDAFDGGSSGADCADAGSGGDGGGD